MTRKADAMLEMAERQQKRRKAVIDGRNPYQKMIYEELNALVTFISDPKEDVDLTQRSRCANLKLRVEEILASLLILEVKCANSAIPTHLTQSLNSALRMVFLIARQGALTKDEEKIFEDRVNKNNTKNAQAKKGSNDDARHQNRLECVGPVFERYKGLRKPSGRFQNGKLVRKEAFEALENALKAKFPVINKIEMPDELWREFNIRKYDPKIFNSDSERWFEGVPDQMKS